MPQFHFMNKLILLFLLVSFVGFSQQTTPFFKSYTKNDYQGENSNWDISQDSCGTIYTANNYKLLEFNGDEWKKYSLSKDVVIRSTEVINDTLYTGAYQEFGYWTHDEKNELIYTSLSSKLKSGFFKNDEIWKIFPYKENIVFQSFKGIYMLNNRTKQVSKIAFPEVSAIFTYEFNDQIYLTTKNAGVFKLKDGVFEFETWSLPLQNYTLQSLVAYKGGVLLGTQLNGIYYVKNGEITEWIPKDSEIINGIEINNLSWIDNKLCIGTINNGLLIVNAEKELLYTINTTNGLLNNTILSQFEDKNGNLWLGLDNGLACVFLSSPLYMFTDKSGQLGTLYAVEHGNDKYTEYLGSNHGVFIKNQNGLQFLENSNGQVWNLNRIDDEIICGHNNGTFQIKNKIFKPISDLSGGVRFITTEEENTYLQANYTGLSEFKKTNDSWEIDSYDKVKFRINEVAIDENGNYWVNSPHNGVSHYKFKNNSLQLERFYDENEVKHIFQLKNVVYLTSKNKILKYDIINDTIIQDQLLTDKLFPFEDVMAFQDKFIVTKNGSNVNILDITSSKTLKLSAKITENKLVQDFDYAKAINDSIYLFLDDGYLLADMSSHEIEVQENTSPSISSLSINGELKKIDSLYEIPYKKNSINISLTNYKPANYIQHQYKYKLVGYDKSWNTLDDNKLNFENLPRGDYELLVKNISGNRESKTLHYQFIILPPWYFSNQAIIGYIILAILSFYLVNLYNKKRYNRKQKRFERELAYKNELELKEEKLENNKRLAELEKKQLKDQLDSKRRELATYAASMAKKEEILNQLESEINKEEIKNEHSKLYDRLNKFKENQSHSADDWKLFERNFNEVHDDFFKKLQEQFPELTPKDLKLCAYLKMNLSSKEIAPLIGITYRSVELHRYRLRKKLDLDKKENLVKFLLSID